MHSSKLINGLIDFYTSPQGKIGIVAGSNPPFFVGYRQAPARNLLEAVLSCLPKTATYSSIIVLSDACDFSSLPVHLTASKRIGSVPCAWFYRGEKKSSTVAGTDLESRIATLNSRMTGRRIIAERQESDWPDSFDWTLRVLHEIFRPATETGGGGLVIVDTSLLCPTYMQFSELREYFNGHRTEGLRAKLSKSKIESRSLSLQGIQELATSCAIDLLFLSYGEASGLQNGQLLRDLASKDYMRAELRFEDNERAARADEFGKLFPLWSWKTPVSFVDADMPGSDSSLVENEYLCVADMTKRGMNGYDYYRTIVPSPKTSVLDQMNSYVGLTAVKEQFTRFAAQARAYSFDKKAGVAVPFNLNVVLRGNPGTGKTEIAMLIAQVLSECGLIPGKNKAGGCFVKATRADLIAGYIGQTATKTRQKCEEALGGVLFIDEAHQLADRDDGFGKECIGELLPWLQEKAGQIAFVIAGYGEEIDRLLASDPGLQSRFQIHIHFPDYEPEELLAIVKVHAKKRQQSFDEACDAIILSRMKEKKERTVSRQFGNGREAVNLLAAACGERNTRLFKTGGTDEEYRRLLPDDFRNAKF